MAIPLIVGLPWLAGVLTSLFTGLITFAVAVFTKRFAIIAAVVVLITTVTGAFMGAAYALVSTVSASMPSGISAGIGLFVPSNASACAGPVAAAYVLKWAYSWQIKVLSFRAS